MNNKSYDRITERIVSLLVQGTVPWHKPWHVKTGLPRNLISQKPYRGINVFLLMAMNYESPNWLTLRQANAAGRPDQAGRKILPGRVLETDEGERQGVGRRPENSVPAPVSCLQRVAMHRPEKHSAADDTAFIQTLPAELVANMPQRPVIKHGMNMASYSPVSDVVNMPDPARFKSEDHYYATLFHELVHATGHEQRLKRASIMERNGYGSDPYAKEELIAELGSAFLCGHTGIVDRTINSSAAYLEGWLKSLKQDRTLIVHAAAQAQKAADFILGHKPEPPAEDIIPKISVPPKPAEVMA